MKPSRETADSISKTQRHTFRGPTSNRRRARKRLAASRTRTRRLSVGLENLETRAAPGSMLLWGPDLLSATWPTSGPADSLDAHHRQSRSSRSSSSGQSYVQSAAPIAATYDQALQKAGTGGTTAHSLDVGTGLTATRSPAPGSSARVVQAGQQDDRSDDLSGGLDAGLGQLLSRQATPAAPSLRMPPRASAGGSATPFGGAAYTGGSFDAAAQSSSFTAAPYTPAAPPAQPADPANTYPPPPASPGDAAEPSRTAASNVVAHGADTNMQSPVTETPNTQATGTRSAFRDSGSFADRYDAPSFDSGTPAGTTATCGFPNDLTDWTVSQSGGSPTGQGTVIADRPAAVIAEGDSFLVTLQHTFQVPETPGTLSFTYADLLFDSTDPDFINDSFEAALVDGDGNSLVHAIAPDRDAFLNFTEGEPAALGPGASAIGQTVTLDVSGLTAGTPATLAFRLVNNDVDTGTSVRITGVQCPSSVVNHAPVANVDTYNTGEDTPVVTGNVLANDSDVDGDPLSIQAFDANSTAGGSVTSNGDGTFKYTPPPNFHGNDSFTYTIQDGQAATASSTVKMVVAPVNDPPVANDDAQTGQQDTLLTTANVLANDSDVDGDPLSIQAFDATSTAGGSVTSNGDGTFDYTPPTGFVGNDSFTYTAADPSGGVDTATVQLTVNPVISDDVADLLAINNKQVFFNRRTGQVDMDLLLTNISTVDIQTPVEVVITGTDNPNVTSVTPLPATFVVDDADGVLSPGESILFTRHTFKNSRRVRFQLQFTATVVANSPLSLTGAAAKESTGATGQVRFYVADAATDRLFGYGPNGTAVGEEGLYGVSAEPRGVTSDASGSTQWVIDGSTYAVARYGSDGVRHGSWLAKGLTDPQGIATDGQDIWVADGGTGQVLRYVGAAALTTGVATASSSFALRAENSSPTGIATDGATIWVSDDAADQVFVYGVDGSRLGQWQLDAGNADPSGITNDPTGDADLWVVDRNDQTVYHYASATSLTGGSGTATSTFALVAGNIAPEGIADPLTGSESAQPSELFESQTIAGVDGSLVEVLLSPDGQRLYAVEQGGTGGSGDVHVIDTNTRQVVTTIPMPESGFSLDADLSPDGHRMYISISKTGGTTTTLGGNRIEVIDTQANERLDPIRIPAGSSFGPTELAVSPDGDTLYVTSRGSNELFAVDLANFLMTSVNIPTVVLYSVESTPNGERLYVVGREGTMLHSVTTSPFQVEDAIPLNRTPNFYNTAIAITPDGSRAYVAYTNDPGISVVDINPQSATFHQEITTIQTGVLPGVMLNMRVNSIGNRLYVPVAGDDSVLVIDVDPGSATYHQVLAALHVNGDYPGISAGPQSVALKDLRIVATPEVASRPVGAPLTIEGRVEPAIGYLGKTSNPDMGSVSVIESLSGPDPVVFVNGRPVDAIDSTGRFFARVTIAPGENTFDFSTTDPAFGQTATTTVTIEGVQEEGADALFDLVSDVSGSLVGEYGRTSLSEDSNVLYADLAIRNAGDYPADTPLLVGITNLSDPSVRVRGFDGRTPEGIPYYDFSNLVDDGTLDPSEVTAARTISFHVPDQIQFTYDLVFLGRLNEAPAITSVPDVEAISGRTYTYDVDATDPNEDELTYSLLLGPSEASINASTGEITWSPASTDVGTQRILVRVDDNRGGWTEQSYTLSIVDPPPNRPPVFTSVPVVDATLGEPHGYDADASDPDGDSLTFTLLNGPVGMSIGSADGIVDWTPGETQLGLHDVTVQVEDSHGGTATQSFGVNVQPNAANHAPIIISEPATTAVLDDGYTYDVDALDPDDDVVNYSLSEAPDDMSINETTGEITWAPTLDDVGQHTVTVHADDDRGGVEEQTFTLELVEEIVGELSVADVDSSGLAYDGQSLHVDGVITATVTNDGTTDLGGPIDVVFFEDSDLDGAFDATIDNVLGSTTITDPLAAGESVPVATSLFGSVEFVENVIWGYVDSGNVVSETDEENNYARHECIFVPEVGSFDPVVEWNKREYSTYPESINVITTPLVIDVNADDVPDVVFTTYYRSFFHAGIVRAVDGRDGQELWSRNSNARAIAQLAAGDIDNDGLPEILGTADGGTMFALENDGTPKFTKALSYVGSGWGGPSIADLDQEGTPEILYGHVVYDNNGDVLWTGAAGTGGPGGGPLSFAADLDLDGVPEVVAGRSAYRNDGSLYWTAAAPDGFSAVGQFDEDPYPEVVLVASNTAYLLEHTGEPVWSRGLTSSFNGGPPTLADFDGDGQPEIGVAGNFLYHVIEGDGTLKWTAPIQDGSSSMTGSSVFDFEGDGSAEVVYADENNFFIFRGADGHVLFQMPRKSATGYEMPVVADVDADGNAEIVIPGAEQDGVPGGIFVIGDANDTWVPTRQIWNQHAYDVTNVNDDGTIPQFAQNSWDVHNTFRANLEPDRSPFAAPDLTVSYVRVDQSSGDATVSARIGNGGEVVVAPGISVAFYDGDPGAGGILLGTVETTQRLEPGQFEDVTIILAAASFATLWVVADDDGTGKGQVNECDELNNVYHYAGTGQIRGTKFADLNGNGSNDSDDEPLADWTIYVDENENARHDLGEPLTRTDANGDYAFTALADGTYTVREEQQPGWESTAPPDGFHTTTIANGELVAGVDFGNQYVGNVGPNEPPEFTSTPPNDAATGGLFRYDAVATDPNNDPLDFDLVVKPRGMAVDSSSGTVVWRPRTEDLGTHDVVLRVRDGQGGVDLQSFQVTVSGNTAPVITSQPTTTAVEGLAYQYLARAQDADGDTVRFRLDQAPDGMTIDQDWGGVAWTAPVLGTHPVVVTALDGQGGESSQTFDLDVVADAPNVPPEITSIPRTQIQAGATYRYQVDVLDPNGDPISFFLDDGPSGMELDAGLLLWTPSADQVGTGYPVAIRVEDDRSGSDTQTFTVDVVSQLVNSAPTITSTPGGTVRIGETYAYNATATDPDFDPIAWRLDASPTGMSVDAQSGKVRWAPSADQVGRHLVELTADDGQGGSTTQSFTIEVRAVNTPPVITSTPPTQAYRDEVFRYPIRAIDADGDTLQFLFAGPPTMTIDAATGVLEWTPTLAEVGTHTITVVARDGQADTQQVFELQVIDGSPNAPPVITSRPEFLATIDQPYTYAIQAVDPEGDTISYSLLGFPAGMTVDSSGLVEWTPSADQEGPHTVIVVATDPLGERSGQRFTLTAALNDAPLIISTAPTTIAVGASYRYDVQVHDPDGDDVEFDLAVAPDGMSIDALGRVQWSPLDIGPHPVEIIVADGRGGEARENYTLEVTQDVTPPVIEITLNANPVNVGDSVDVIVNAVDDVGVIATALFLGTTPVVLGAADRATLRPDTAGRYDLRATATDAANNLGETTVALDVADPSDADAPVVSITSPEYGQQITGPVDVVGSVNDDSLVLYTLSYAPLEGGPFVELARGTQPVAGGVLGSFDPSLLANDTYILELFAQDAGGKTSVEQILVDVTGDLKIGNFALSFTDLTVPVSGIPITIARTYDSLNAAHQDDFGYGWRMEIKDTDLRSSVAETGAEEDLIYNPFYDGARLYVTVPGGRREGFTFRITPAPGYAGSILGIFRGRFVPDQGVDSTISFDHYDLRVSEFGEAYDYGTGLPFNPASPVFGGQFTVTTREGIEYQIEGDSGDLTSVADRNGNTLTFTDSGVFSSTGVGITFERDPQGRITDVIDPAGNRTRYTYDPAGDLVGVTDREGNATAYEYDEPTRPHLLTNVIDPLGRTGVRSEYDDAGRLVRMVDADGQAVQLVHDPDNFVETIENQLGHATTYEYDNRGNVLTEIDPEGGVTRRTYDDPHDPTLETTVTQVLADGTELTTAYQYDADGNVIAETDPLGRQTLSTYDQFGNVLTTTDPLGNTTTNTYDSKGNLLSIVDPAGQATRFTYDAAGNPLTMSLPGGNTQTFTYDSSGNVLTQTDALGNVTAFTYDAMGNQLTETRTQSTPTGTRTIVTESQYDASGRVRFQRLYEDGVLQWETETQFDAVGNRVAQTDALGRTTRWVYDDRGLLTEAIYPDDTPNDDTDNPRTRTEYDAAGQTIAEIDERGRRTEHVYDKAGRQIAMIYPDDTPGDQTDNPRTQTEYDAAGRTVAQIDQRGNRTEFVLDAAGQQVEVILPDSTPADLTDNSRTRTEYDAAGRSVAQIDPLGYVTMFEYDDAGRPVRTVFEDGSSTRSVFDDAGRLASRIDQAGRATDYEYDVLGRLTAVILPEVDDPISGSRTRPRTEYEYDELGNMVDQRDARGRETRFEYDGQGRRTATILPLGQRSTTGYDAVGNVTSTTDFNGDTIRFEYDVRDRMTLKDLPGTFPDVMFTYTATSQLDTVTDGRGTTEFAYDAQDRLVSRTDPDGASIAYTYDIAGNRTSVTTLVDTNAPRVTNYSFDEQNRLATVIDADGDVTSYSYDAAGRLVRTDLPNNTFEARTYDTPHRLTLVEHRNAATDQVLASFAYELDAVGNRTAMTEHDGRRVEHDYDELHRLVGESIFDPGLSPDVDPPSRTIDYTYDIVGNRLTRDDSAEGLSSYTYDDNDRLLTETLAADVTQYTYDDNGNTLSKESATDSVFYKWDPENRLIAADTDGDGTDDVTYQYDHEGLRVSKTAGGVETRFLLDKNRPYAQVLEEYTPGGILKVSYVHGLDLLSQNRHGDTGKAFYHVDGLGSTRALSDALGIITDRYIYDAFGNTIGQVGSTGNVYLFAGEQRDGAIGLDYLRARWVDIVSGRFVSRDTFEGTLFEPKAQHDFHYVANNPLNDTDPSGRVSLLTLVAAVATVTVVAAAGRAMIVAKKGQPADESAPPDVQLTPTQQRRIVGVINFENSFGTYVTAYTFSNTWGTEKLGDEFNNKPIPTAAGVIDLDWYTDVMSATLGFAGDSNILSRTAAFLAYAFGKGIWNSGRKVIGWWDNQEVEVAWWFQDRKELKAIEALFDGYRRYRDLFPKEAQIADALPRL